MGMGLREVNLDGGKWLIFGGWGAFFWWGAADALILRRTGEARLAKDRLAVRPALAASGDGERRPRIRTDRQQAAVRGRLAANRENVT